MGRITSSIFSPEGRVKDIRVLVRTRELSVVSGSVLPLSDSPSIAVITAPGVMREFARSKGPFLSISDTFSPLPV